MNIFEKTVGFKSGERNVFFHILTKCNLSCTHCYINHVQHGNEILSKEQARKWLELFSHPSKKTNLIILGGEPTLHPDLSFIIREAKKLKYFVTVDTNGFLFHDILEKTNPQVLDFISFSLDGPNAQVNDPIRGEGVFEKCTQGIREAVRLGYNVSLIYTVSQKNIHALVDMVDLLEDLQVNKFFIQVLGLRGETLHSGDTNLAQVSRKQWLETVPEVARLTAQKGIHVTYPKVFLDREETFECAGNVAENYFIFPNGRVYTCPLCEDHPLHSYEIIDDKLCLRKGLHEKNFFTLSIDEGCVMNKLLQPETIEYDDKGRTLFKISCCLLKQEVEKRNL